ncbi:MAG: putative DNA binding domain-containing protein [Caldilineaceae bacterium]|nr:putative DNA binding domain-containing protein [Caldilineaceae bacterium]
MSSYTDTELAELFGSGESELVERKRSVGDGNAIRRSICAFANDLPARGKPGVLFVGVEDDATCAGLDVNDELLRHLAQMRSDGSIQPFPTMTVDKKTIDGCEMAVVQVMPAKDPPLRFRGRAWIRVGPTVQQATPEEEQRLVERRIAGQRSFDMRPVTDASIDDLDIEYVRANYLPGAVAREILERNQRPVVQQLSSLRLLHQGHPTQGALIAFGRDPQFWAPGAYVQFLRIAGLSITDPIKSRKELTGKLEDVLSRLQELMEINVSVSANVLTGAREVRIPDYPIEALRQLAANAVMHRTYENSNAPCRVYWYDDRIEIQNPGSLYGNVTPLNIHEGVTDYRNPLLAEIMHHLGFAQRFGLGIQLAKTSLKDNGNPPPEFSFSATHVSVVVRGLT